MWECWESLLECRHLGSSPDGVKIESSFTVFRGNVWEGTQVSNEVATLNEGWSGGHQGWPGGEKHCSVVQIRFSLQLSCFNLVPSTSKFWRMIRHGNPSSFLPAKAFHRWSEVCDAFDLYWAIVRHVIGEAQLRSWRHLEASSLMSKDLMLHWNRIKLSQCCEESATTSPCTQG